MNDQAEFELTVAFCTLVIWFIWWWVSRHQPDDDEYQNRPGGIPTLPPGYGRPKAPPPPPKPRSFMCSQCGGDLVLWNDGVKVCKSCALAYYSAETPRTTTNSRGPK